MTESTKDTVEFEGEDPNSGYAAPTLDMIAAGFLVVLSAVVMMGVTRFDGS